MDLLRKIDTRVVRQTDGNLKREIYQALDTILQVDRERPGGDVVAFEMAWDDAAGRRLFIAWTRGAEVKAGETDTGEDAFGQAKRAPVEKASRLGSAEIVHQGRRIVEERAGKLPGQILRILWMCLGDAGPGAQTTTSLPGIVRKKPS